MKAFAYNKQASEWEREGKGSADEEGRGREKGSWSSDAGGGVGLAWTGALIVRSFAYALHLHANEAAGKKRRGQARQAQLLPLLPLRPFTDLSYSERC